MAAGHIHDGLWPRQLPVSASREQLDRERQDNQLQSRMEHQSMRAVLRHTSAFKAAWARSESRAGGSAPLLEASIDADRRMEVVMREMREAGVLHRSFCVPALLEAC